MDSSLRQRTSLYTIRKGTRQTTLDPAATISNEAEHNPIDKAMKDSSISSQLPSQPSRVFLRRNHQRIDEEAGITGQTAPGGSSDVFQRSQPSQSMLPEKNKEKPHKMDKIMDKDARKFFDRIASGTPCLFLCIGPPQRCRIVQVRLKDDDDDLAALKEMKKTWQESRTWLPFCKVTRVGEVTFRFSGDEEREDGVIVKTWRRLRTWLPFHTEGLPLPGCKDGTSVIGTYETFDTERLRFSLSDKAKAIEESLIEWPANGPDYPPYYCGEDTETGHLHHSSPCGKQRSRACEIEELNALKHRLRSLSLVPLLTPAFQSSTLAKGQRLLKGLAGEGPGIYSSRDMLRGLYCHDPRIGDIVFNGYKITEEWDDITCRAAILFLLASTIAAFLFRVVFGDWQTAIAASTMGIAILALVIQWMTTVAKNG